eukprot:3758899-Rhodomonas_salina.1
MPKGVGLPRGVRAAPLGEYRGYRSGRYNGGMAGCDREIQGAIRDAAGASERPRVMRLRVTCCGVGITCGGSDRRCGARRWSGSWPSETRVCYVQARCSY